MAYAGNRGKSEVEGAFHAAANTLQLDCPRLVAKTDISLSSLDLSLQKLEQLKPMVKLGLLKACVTSLMHDQVILPLEVELLRAFSDVLGCPIPPIDS